MLKVEYVKTEELKPYANNAKLHPAQQVEQIKESIREFGFNDPIAVWKDNEIIEGHGRLIASMELGIEEVPIIRLDELTDEQRKAYALVHNKLTMNSDFDEALLNMELEEIGVDMSKFGFELGLDDIDVEIERTDISDSFEWKNRLVVECETEEDQQTLFEELSERGFECTIE